MTEMLRIAYRDHDRTPLLYVIKDQAARFEDLKLDILHVPGGDDYRSGFLSGKFELICEHLRFLFPARLKGHPVRCLAATQIEAVDRFVAMPAIRTVADMKGKRVAVRENESSQITLKYWLRSLGLADQVEIGIHSDKEIGRWEQWRKVVKGDADIALCSPLYLQAPLQAGLEVVNVPPLPVIGPLFFATREPVIRQQEEAIRRFMRALYRAMEVFRNDRQQTIAIMAQGPAQLMGLADVDAIERQYEVLRNSTAERPIPLPEAIQNTFHMVGEAYDVAALNPLTLWDLRYVIELEEKQFMDGLVQGRARK
jgi:ABC-type nitrate/sulfonate/bicarbonate transport system substrate-binding protein